MTSPVEAPRTLVTADGATIAYRLWRPGAVRRVLVLLHGVASNMTRWSEFVTVTRLRDSWDLLRLDLRGHGLSVHRGRIGMTEWCADLAAILDTEGYSRAVVAGHCLGAHIALEFAVRYPTKATSLVLIEPTLRAALTGPMRWMARLRWLFIPVVCLIHLLNSLRLYRRRLPRLDLEDLDRRTRAAMTARGSPDALLRQYASPWSDLRTTPSAVYLQSLIAMTAEPPALSDVSIPTLALVSTGKLLSDPTITADLLAELPNCRIVRLDAQHWIPTEQPEAMRRAVEDWCDQPWP